MYKNFDDFLLSLNKDETIDSTSEIVDKIMETVTNTRGTVRYFCRYCESAVC